MTRCWQAVLPAFLLGCAGSGGAARATKAVDRGDAGGCVTQAHADVGLLFVRHPGKAFAVPLPFSSDWKLDCRSSLRFDAESSALTMWVTLHADHTIVETPFEFLEVERRHQLERAPASGIVIDKAEILAVGPVSILRLRQHRAASPALGADAYWVARTLSDGTLAWIHLTYAGPPAPSVDTVVVNTLTLWAK